APSLDAEGFGHGDLHTLDMVAIPERFQERVGEAEEEQVVHRPLAQVMVDAEDRLLPLLGGRGRHEHPSGPTALRRRCCRSWLPGPGADVQRPAVPWLLTPPWRGL